MPFAVRLTGCKDCCHDESSRSLREGKGVGVHSNRPPNASICNRGREAWH